MHIKAQFNSTIRQALGILVLAAWTVPLRANPVTIYVAAGQSAVFDGAQDASVSSITKIGTGSLEITHWGNVNTLTVNAGVVVADEGYTTDYEFGLSVESGNVFFTQSMTLGYVYIKYGCVTLTESTSGSPPSAVALGTKYIDIGEGVRFDDAPPLTIEFSNGGTLDVTNNVLVVRNDDPTDPNEDDLSAEQAEELIYTGLYGLSDNPGYWAGPGIYSSTAGNDATQVHALGVIGNEEAQYTSIPNASGDVASLEPVMHFPESKNHPMALWKLNSVLF